MTGSENHLNAECNALASKETIKNNIDVTRLLVKSERCKAHSKLEQIAADHDLI
jgi:hypothetical protein